MRIPLLLLILLISNPLKAAISPDNQEVLFWSHEDRQEAFSHMDTYFPIREIPAAQESQSLYKGDPLAIPELDAILAREHAVGIVVLHQGKVRLEHYTNGHTADKHWQSFSVGKSVTSTLLGAAIQDGAIGSVDDPVTTYLPELVGSAYEGVSIHQLLTMTSGVAWNEDYTDKSSDVARFHLQDGEAGEDATITYMKKLNRAYPAGTQWHYKTGETNLVGLLVSRATGKSLSQYLSEKIWQPMGMEKSATWMLGKTSHEISGCCIGATLRDFARFGQFVLADGKLAGQSVVPEGWFDIATTHQVDIPGKDLGYGYQWWVHPDGTFSARGIFGQTIFIDRERELVVVMNANWPEATSDARKAQRMAFFAQIQSMLDRESA